ncbi:MAG TPA: DUF6382 domain-containing protein [Clostridiales bacterium]|nr:DUF6382 domain-containing protein [Clostridiales bacterium]HOL91899.1 DUF6382 domain-containing protein [Clostridiales bacterium]HPP35731.1 DUF6382 domain-containing protein [Clostridiales bacterium]
MSGVAAEAVKELEFIYESDAASSFLVIRCAGNIIGYQAGMFENNDIEYVIPMEIVKKEDANYFYYNITSRIPLSIYLKRNKLSREAFLRLILNITACISNSAGYLLYPSNFLMKPEFIYIDPGTLDVMTVYIPAEFRHDDAGSLQTLVSELLMQHINEEGFSSGNLVQRILSEVKSETFSIRGLITLVNELLYSPDIREKQKPPYEPEICIKMAEENREKYKKEEKKEAMENIRKKKPSPAVVIAVLLQLAMGIAIYMCRGIIAGTGNDATVNYIAVALIILAIEVLIFRKLQAMKLFSIRDIVSTRPDKDGEPDAIPGEAMAQNAFIQTTGHMRKSPADCETDSRKNAIAEKAAARNDISIPQGESAEEIRTDLKAKDAALPPESGVTCFSQKTESLEMQNESEFVLINMNGQPGEKNIVIDRDEFIVGRLAGHVDHILYSNAVGKLHAVLIRRNGCCYVKDLNSMNGTYINGKRIECNKEMLLKNNDILRLANCEFIFSCRQENKPVKQDNDKEAEICMAEGLYGMAGML